MTYYPSLSLPLCRDAVNDLALHYLAKMKVLVVRDIEREDIEFISRVKIPLTLAGYFTSSFRLWAAVLLLAWTTSFQNILVLLSLSKKSPQEVVK